jgi:hypothetical protein
LRAGACLIHAPVPDLADATLEDLDARLARLGSAPAVDLDISVAGVAASSPSAEERKVRLLYAMKKLSSAARASLPGRKVLVSLTANGEMPWSEVEQVARIVLGEDLEPYVDRVGLPPVPIHADPDLFARPWARTAAAGPGGAVNAVLEVLAGVPAANPVQVGGGRQPGRLGVVAPPSGVPDRRRSPVIPK